MNYELVTHTISTLEQNWDDGIYPGTYADRERPEILNQDEAKSRETGKRSEYYDLSKNNAITVGGAETASVQAIGTEYDHRIEEPVSVLIEGVHDSEWGHLSGGQEFTDLVRAARYAIAADRVWPYRNPTGPVHYHSLFFDNPVNQAPDNKDYFAYSFEVRYVGYEEFPAMDDVGEATGFGASYDENYDH